MAMLYSITLYVIVSALYACSANSGSSSNRSVQTGAINPDNGQGGAPPSETTPTDPGLPSGDPSQTDANTNPGTIAVNIGDELVTTISAALVASGLTQDQVAALDTNVRSSGVLAIETGEALRLVEALSPLELLAPDVAGAFVASLSIPEANLSEELRKKAIAVVTESTVKFTGEKDVTDEARPNLLGSIAQAVIINTKEASLSADGAIEAIGLVADASFGGMIDAGIKTDSLTDTAQLLSEKIGEGLGGAGLDGARIPDALSKAAEKAGGALGRLPLPNAAAAITSTTEGFVNGIAASSKISRDAKVSAVAEIPRGLNSTVPGWLPAKDLANTLDKVTDTTLTSFVAKLDPTSQELVAKIPRIAEGSLAGLAKSGIPTTTAKSDQLATRPLQAIMNRLDKVVTDPAQRLEVVQNTLNKSISALANSTSESFATDLAPELVSKTFELATDAYNKFDVDKTNTTKVTAFYDSIMKGAIDGVAGLGSANQQRAAITATGVLAKTMDAAVNSLSTMFSDPNLSISEDVLKNLPARAAQNVGERLAKVLSADDLNQAYATATSQYIYNIQSVAATKATSVDVGELANRISADALASFSGAWNARPAEIQTAVTALNNRLGTMSSGLDPRVIASVQGGAQTVVVQAAGGSDAITTCPTVGTTTLAVCTKALSADCPSSPGASLTPGYKLIWQADATLERCFMYRELVVQSSANTNTCGDDSEYVYGIGCRKTVKTCGDGETFVYGVGCQKSVYYCPAGQKFTVSQGCVADNVSRYSCANGERWTSDGCKTASNNCPIGYKLENSRCVAATSTPQCPAGSTYNSDQKTCILLATTNTSSCRAGTYQDKDGSCKPNGSCSRDSYWDPRSQQCQPASACVAPMQWDATAQSCRAVNSLALACDDNQILIAGTCKQCPEGMAIDTIAKTCRPSGACSPGFEFNAERNQCEFIRITECNATEPTPPTAPSLDSAVSLSGAIQLSWTGDADGYVLIRKTDSGANPMPENQRPYAMRDTVGDGNLIIFRGSNRIFTDYEAKESGLLYHYQLHAVRFFCKGPYYSSGVSTSARPLSSVSADNASFVAPNNFELIPEFPAAGQVGGIRLLWNRAFTEISGTPVQATRYLIARHDPVPSVENLSLPTFNADRAYIDAPLGDGWKIVYNGENNSYIDFSTDLEPNKHSTGFVYALAATYRTDSGPKFAPSSTKKANIVIVAGATAPIFLGISLAGPLADQAYNADEKNAGVAANLVNEPLKAGTESNATYAVVTATTVCSDISDIDYQSTKPTHPTNLSGLADGDYKVCVKLTDTSNQSVYGSSPSFTIDTNLPLFEGNFYTPFAGTASGVTVSGARYVQWQIKTKPADAIVTFSNPNQAQTQITLSKNGNYELELIARDAAGNSNQKSLIINDFTVPATSSISRIVVTSAPPLLVTGVCSPAVVEIQDANNASTKTESALNVTLSASAAGVFSDNQCQSNTSFVTIPAENSSATFYLRTWSGPDATATIHVTIPGLSDQRSIPRAAFQLAGAASDQLINANDSTNTDSLINMIVAPIGITKEYKYTTESSCSDTGWVSVPPSASNLFGATGSPFLICLRFSNIPGSAGTSIIARSPSITVDRTPPRATVISAVIKGVGQAPAGACVPQYLELKDDGGNPFTAATSLTFAITKSTDIRLYSDASCTTAASSLIIASGRSQTNFYAMLSDTSDTTQSITASSGTISTTKNLDVLSLRLKGVAEDGVIRAYERNVSEEILDVGSYDNGKMTIDFALTRDMVCSANLPYATQIPAFPDAFNSGNGKYTACLRLGDDYNYFYFAVARIELDPQLRINLTTTNAVVAFDSCTHIRIQFLNASHSPDSISAPLMARTGWSSTQAFFSDSSCTTALPEPFSLPTNTSTKDIYVRATSPGEMRIVIRDDSPSSPQAATGILFLAVDTQVFAGNRHSCQISPSGSLKCWGMNDEGQLGDGSQITRSTQTTIASGTIWHSIALGNHHTCALRDDFNVFCWGNGSRGQLGVNSYTSVLSAISATKINFPAQLKARAITAGDDHTCAILDDLSAVCWGANEFGQLGNDSLTDAKTPVFVKSGNTRFSQLVARGSSTCGIVFGLGNPVQCWGNNAQGQLGIGSTASLQKTPQGLAFGAAYLPIRLALGPTHACMLFLENGTSKLSCWGNNQYNQLGVTLSTDGILDDAGIALRVAAGAPTFSTKPVTVPTTGSPIMAALGEKHTCLQQAVSGQSQRLTCWGTGLDGQLGYGPTTTIRATSGASYVMLTYGGTLTPFDALSLTAGSAHTCAVARTGGTPVTKCWGQGTYGQLGNGQTGNLFAP